MHLGRVSRSSHLGTFDSVHPSLNMKRILFATKKRQAANSLVRLIASRSPSPTRAVQTLAETDTSLAAQFQLSPFCGGRLLASVAQPLRSFVQMLGHALNDELS